MQTLSTQKVQDHFKKLSREVQDVIVSVDTADKLRYIGEKYKLSRDQTNELSDETGLVLLGFTPRELLPKNLKERMNIHEEIASDIANDINKQILLQVRKRETQVENKNEDIGHLHERQNKSNLSHIKRELEQNKTERIVDILQDIEQYTLNMDENTKKILKKQFRTLPDSVKKAIASGDIERILNTLTEDHPLQDHQLIAIENEIVLILLGFEDFSSFTTNIKHGAQISRERAERIAKLIHREIFIPNQAVLSIKTAQKESHNSPTSLETINADHKNNIIKKQEINPISQDAPQQSSPSENDMFHKKLTQQVHIPNEEEKINLAEDGEKKEQKKSPQGYAEDPYREPID